MSVLGVHISIGSAPSNRPQYFAPSYILWIEIFLVQKNAGESRTFSPQLGTGSQIHCGTPALVEKMDTVPIPRYTNQIRWTGRNNWAAENQIVIKSPKQRSQINQIHQLLSEQGARYIYKIQQASV